MCFFPKKFFWHCIYYVLYIHNISFIIEPFCSDLNFFFLDWFNKSQTHYILSTWLWTLSQLQHWRVIPGSLRGSHELKAQLSFSDCLSSVCLSVHLSVCNFSYFRLLKNHWANFNQTWHKASFGEGDSSLFKWRALPFSKGR